MHIVQIWVKFIAKVFNYKYKYFENENEYKYCLQYCI